MARHHTTDGTDDCGLHRLERNRYFHGKLMTARDMAAEQEYHRNSVRMLAQYVSGEGIVCGLETTVDENEGSLVVGIEPGLAIDCCGHPIVVESETTEEIDLDDVADPTSLYIDYDDCVKETVPIPGSEDACQEECTYNRILEIFRIDHRSAPPEEQKRVRSIEFPERADFDDPTDPDPTDDALRRIATSYGEDDEGAIRPCGSRDDHGVFLGRFERGSDGNWSRVSDAEERAFVYTNDMLYAAIARHAASFGNPHDVTTAQIGALESVETVRNPGGNVDLNSPDGTLAIAPNQGANRVDLDVSTELRDRLSQLETTVTDLAGTVETLQGTIEDLEGRVSPLERYVMDKTLKYKRDAFSGVEVRFESEIAGEIVARTNEAIDEEIYRDPESYREFVERISEPESDLREDVEETATERSLERYDGAIEELREVLGSEVAIVEIAVAQDLVCETAEELEIEGEGLRESLQNKRDSFGDVSGRFDSRAANEVAVTVQEALAEGIHEDEGSYRELLRRLLGLEREVASDVGRSATQTSLERYLSALREAAVTFESEPEDVQREADAQNRVSAAARRLDRGRDRIPEPTSSGEDTTANDRESTLATKRESFVGVVDRFDSHIAEEIVAMTDEAIDAGVHEDGAEFVGFIEEVLGIERRLPSELAGEATPASLGAYATAVEELGQRLEAGADPVQVAAAQDRVSAAAGGLESGAGLGELTVDPRELTVSELRTNIESVETRTELESMLAAELAGEDRTTATDLIRSRMDSVTR